MLLLRIIPTHTSYMLDAFFILRCIRRLLCITSTVIVYYNALPGSGANLAIDSFVVDPNVRIICHDEGVDGEFRIRNLRILGSREGSTTTQTRVKEHGHFIHVDPAKTYFSGRLSEQRKMIHKAILNFLERTRGTRHEEGVTCVSSQYVRICFLSVMRLPPGLMIW